MDKTLLFKIPYGMYIISTENNGKLAGCIVNTAIQITDEPTNMVVSIDKKSHTANMIKESKKCIIGMLSENTNLNIIRHFSMISGYNENKFSEKYKEIFSYTLEDNMPIISENMVCNLVCDVIETIDSDSHYLFVLRLTKTIDVDSKLKIMTYENYRKLKNNIVIEKETNETIPSYICSVCHYTYDGEIPFEELGEDYRCPVCGRGKDAFLKIN